MSAKPFALAASVVAGTPVVNPGGDDLGKLTDIVVELQSGRIAYAVLAFGGFLGLGDKLFAVPWQALQVDTENQRFCLEVPRERLEAAPGFDKEHWPDMADPAFHDAVHAHFGYPKPSWSP
jgi:hypothetical protein